MSLKNTLKLSQKEVRNQIGGFKFWEREGEIYFITENYIFIYISITHAF